jgi:hypothetical protein
MPSANIPSGLFSNRGFFGGFEPAPALRHPSGSISNRYSCRLEIDLSGFRTSDLSFSVRYSRRPPASRSAWMSARPFLIIFRFSTPKESRV